MKVMQLRTVGSDGRPCVGKEFPYYPIDPETGRPYAGDDGAPAVTLMLRPLTREQEKAIRKTHTKPESVKGVGIHETSDQEAIFDDLVDHVIVSWTGILAADGRPAPCVLEAKKALDVVTRMDIIAKARTAESVEVSAATFRESARVAALVG